MTFREVILSINGLRDRDKMLEGWIRRATLIIASTNFGGKTVASKFDRLWPVEHAVAKVSEKALEQLRQMRERQAIIDAQQKIKNG